MMFATASKVCKQVPFTLVGETGRKNYSSSTNEWHAERFAPTNLTLVLSDVTRVARARAPGNRHRVSKRLKFAARDG